MNRQCTVYKVTRTWTTDLEPGVWYELSKNDGRDLIAGFVFIPFYNPRGGSGEWPRNRSPYHAIIAKGVWDFRDIDGKQIARRGNLKGNDKDALEDKLRGFEAAVLTKRHGTCWCETPLYPARGVCPRCVAERTEVPQL